MALISNLVKKMVLPSLFTTGLEKRIFDSGGNNLLILAYHGVTERPELSINGRHLDVKQFISHLEYYKQNFDIVSQAEIVQMYREGVKPKRKTLALTFDDCYLNNFEVVFPLIKKYNVPAVFYSVSSVLENENYILYPDIFDLLSYYTHKPELEYDGVKFIKKGKHFFTTDQPVSLFDYIKNQGEERINKLENFKDTYGFNEVLKIARSDYWRQINKEKLRMFAASELVEIGSHTHNHFNLANIKPDLCRNELTLSKKLIEEVIQKEVKSIAFPDGSYNEEVKKLCREAGYSNLLAVDSRCADDKADKSLFPRWCISNTTSHEVNMLLVHKSFKKYGF